MKYIIRTIENGERLSVERIEEKQRALKEKILESGMNYLEFDAFLGSYNELGKRVKEPVHVIEPISGVSYV